MHVVETVHELVEVSTGDVRAEATAQGNKVEELTSACVLDDDGEALETE